MSNFVSKKNKIAVVNDDLGMLEWLELALQSAGYHTELFSSAGEFLAAVPKLEVGCIIIELGGLSGLDLVRALCAAGFAVPIVLITGSPENRYRPQAIKLGCAAFLGKPVSTDQLIEAVARAIRSTHN
jgi:two-component system, LuxR family, response regulator FixJ